MIKENTTRLDEFPIDFIVFASEMGEYEKVFVLWDDCFFSFSSYSAYILNRMSSCLQKNLFGKFIYSKKHHPTSSLLMFESYFYFTRFIYLSFFDLHASTSNKWINLFTSHIHRNTSHCLLSQLPTMRYFSVFPVAYHLLHQSIVKQNQ